MNFIKKLFLLMSFLLKNDYERIVFSREKKNKRQKDVFESFVFDLIEQAKLSECGIVQVPIPADICTALKSDGNGRNKNYLYSIFAKYGIPDGKITMDVEKGLVEVDFRTKEEKRANAHFVGVI